MIKECKVVSYNKFLNILVFNYDGKQIQTTTILDVEQKTVFIRYKDEKYEIVNRDEYDKYIQNMKKKDMSVKPTKKEKVLKLEDDVSKCLYCSLC